ncbi:MAG: ATP-binding protein, partial [Burkholderiales bacterium]
MAGTTRGKKTGAGRPKLAGSGKLRIGDDWNAITIIALSQDNPLKAIAEFVENSIDAGAKNVLITRSRERGEHFLTVADDGTGVRKNDEGAPDFRYVATHICDSIKRQLKSGGIKGIQGEFGIGLLSFWTVGEALAMSAGGDDGAVHEMHMRKGDPGYEVTRRPVLAPEPGTRLKIGPLLPGVRQISGEKIQWYLASELRERIRHAGVSIKVIDRHARKEFKVEPRQFTGDLLHQLPAVSAPQGEAYAELYLNPPDAANEVGLYRSGTRILRSLAELDTFRKAPWTDGYLQGIVDVPYLNLTPATRTGVIHDAALETFATALSPLEARLLELIAEHRRAEEERMSRDTLRSIQRAFREALLTLPSEEYEWFDV